VVLPTAPQTPEQQIINDATTALGGRDRVVAIKTMLLEGAGKFVGITSLRYDDDIGFKSAIEQLRDVKRAYDLANTRARFELTRMVEYVFYIGDAPTRTIPGLDGTVAFNINPSTQNATPALGNQGTARRLDYLRHPLTLVRAALGPDAKLSNSRTERGRGGGTRRAHSAGEPGAGAREGLVACVRAVWARAKELRPNKPITQPIVTHHHFDHTGGVRDRSVTRRGIGM
jgi:hypothetical protein